MCRQGGYYDQAVFLAKKNQEHELVIDILIEDSRKYEDALDYIWRLEPSLAYPNLMKYARVLLEHCPEDATQIFIDYYTGQYRPKKDLPMPASQVPQGGASNAVSNLTSFIPLPYRQNKCQSVSCDCRQSAACITRYRCSQDGSDAQLRHTQTANCFLLLC